MKTKSRLPLIIGVLALGWLAGTVQGYNQCERNWKQKVVERSTCYEQEGPVPIYEDYQGTKYYSFAPDLPAQKTNKGGQLSWRMVPRQ